MTRSGLIPFSRLLSLLIRERFSEMRYRPEQANSRVTSTYRTLSWAVSYNWHAPIRSPQKVGQCMQERSNILPQRTGEGSVAEMKPSNWGYFLTLEYKEHTEKADDESVKAERDASVLGRYASAISDSSSTRTWSQRYRIKVIHIVIHTYIAIVQSSSAVCINSKAQTFKMHSWPQLY